MSSLKNKKVIVISAVIILVVAAILFFFLTSNNGYRKISISDISGTVIAENNGNSYQAYENMSIGGGYALNTGKDSYTLMELDDDKYVKLEQESRAIFENLGNDKNRNTVINLEKGVLTTEIVKPLANDEGYVVNTPNAVLSVRGTYFRVEVSVDENGDYFTNVYTYGGAVACKRILPDGTIIDEEVLAGQGYKACVKMDEIETIYIEELIEEQEDKVDPIEMQEISDDDLVGIYNASINGHEMFRDSETLWNEIDDRNIDISKHRSPYDKKPVPEFDKDKHGNGGHRDDKHDVDEHPADSYDITETTAVPTESEQTVSEAVPETEITETSSENQSEITAESQIITPESTADVGGATNPVIITTPYIAVAVTTVEASETTITTISVFEETTPVSEDSVDETEETTDKVTTTAATTTTAGGAIAVTSPSFVVTPSVTSSTEITTIVSQEITTTAPTETTTTTTNEAHVCEFTDYVSDNNATCTKDGTKTAVCECSKTDTIIDEGSATGHTEVEETVEATFVAEGSYTKSCSVCNEILETKTIERLPALYTEDGDITITETGYTQGDAAVEMPFTGDYVISQRDSSVAVDCAISIDSGTHNVTLDGVNIVSSGDIISVVSGSEISLVGNDVNEFSVSGSDYFLNNYGKVNISDGVFTINGSSGTGRAIGVQSGAMLVIENGEYKLGTYVFEPRDISKSCFIGINNEEGVVKILGGTFNCGGQRPIVTSGEMSISDGSLIITGANYAVLNNGGNLKISGGSVVAITENETKDSLSITNGGITKVIGGSMRLVTLLSGSVTNGTDELECIVFDTFPTETQRTFMNSDGTSYVYALTEADKADDGKYYVWKPVGMIAINEVNFPDEVFRNYVSTNFDTDSSGYLLADEIEAVTEINVSGYMAVDGGVETLQGVEHFTKLSILKCGYNAALTELDISKNTVLKELRCYNSAITNLDLSNNTILSELHCNNTPLSSLDVSNNTALDVLYCHDTKILSLDVNRNTTLTELHCYNTGISSLDLSNNIALKWLTCYNTGIINLDLSNNTALEYLWCEHTEITRLNVNNNIALTDLRCNNTAISELDVSNNIALVTLYCQDTDVSELDLSANISLKYFCCDNTKLSGLNLSKNVALVVLQCENSYLTYIDIANSASISTFMSDGNAYVIPSNAIIFDTSTIEGFNPTKVSNVTGADFDASTGIFSNITGDVTYTYDCGQGYSETFTLTRTD